MIHVCYGLHDKDGRYSKFTGTSMLSMFENCTPPPPCITVHILHDNTLTADNRDKFSYIASQYGQIVKFHDVQKDYSDELIKIHNSISNHSIVHLTVAALYRLFISRIFPKSIEKVIYLDSDTIVNLDIGELWHMDIGDKPLAVVANGNTKANDNLESPPYLCAANIVRVEDYFNSGVMLMNLKTIRKKEYLLQQGIRFVIEHPQCEFLDQDVLNYCFSKKTLRFPLKFNKLVFYAKHHRDFDIRAEIYHYAARMFGLNPADSFDRLWLKYFTKTPWFNVDTLFHMLDVIREIQIGQKNLMTQISALISGKTRAFFVAPQNAEAAKNILYVQPHEEFIVADSPESLRLMAKSLSDNRDKKVFFILSHEYPAIKKILTNSGFVEGRDFLNAMLFLSDATGVPLNTYPFVNLL